MLELFAVIETQDYSGWVRLIQDQDVRSTRRVCLAMADGGRRWVGEDDNENDSRSYIRCIKILDDSYMISLKYQ